VLDAYINGDIVLTAGFAATLRVAVKWYEGRQKHGNSAGMLLTGRRTNVDYNATDTLHSDAATIEKSKLGHLFQTDALDYFVYARGTRNWTNMPAFVVGRVAYDNWLVDNSFHDKHIGACCARVRPVHNGLECMLVVRVLWYSRAAGVFGWFVTVFACWQSSSTLHRRCLPCI